MPAKVTKLPDSGRWVRKRIADIAEQSESVFFTKHALARMKQRKISRLQAIEVLRKGHVVEREHQNVRGDWECKLERTVAGERIAVACVLKGEGNSEIVVVITAIRS